MPPSDDDTVTPELDRSITQLEHKIETSRQQLRSKLKQIGVPPSSPVEDTAINQEQFIRQGSGYGYYTARKARTLASNIKSQKQRLEQLRQRQKNYRATANSDL